MLYKYLSKLSVYKFTFSIVALQAKNIDVN